MIKRLKWNVLHGGGDGAESDGGLTSSSEEEDAVDIIARQAEANSVLQELVDNDPDLAEILHGKFSAMAPSSDDDDADDEHSDEDDRQVRAAGLRLKKSEGGGLNNEHSGDDDKSKDEACNDDAESDAIKEVADSDQKYAEWRECNLCPGKRFLSDVEVNDHLGSKKHLRAVVKYEKRMQREAAEKQAPAQPDALGEEGGKIDGTKKVVRKEEKAGDGQERAVGKEENVGSHVTLAATAPRIANSDTNAMPKEDEHKKGRRKAATKRKLKALKRRKWEKMKAENALAKDAAEEKDETGDSQQGVRADQSTAKSISAPAPSGKGKQSDSTSKKKSKAKSPRGKGRHETLEGQQPAQSTGKGQGPQSSIDGGTNGYHGDVERSSGDNLLPWRSGTMKRGRELGSQEALEKKKLKRRKKPRKDDVHALPGQDKVKGSKDEAVVHQSEESGNGVGESGSKKKKKKKSVSAAKSVFAIET